MVRDMNFFWEKNLSNYILQTFWIVESADWKWLFKSNGQVNNVSEIVVSEAQFTSIMGFTNYRSKLLNF